MRLVVLSLFSIAAALYALAAFSSYREEMLARDTTPLVPPAAEAERRPPMHPEANLRRLREAFADGEYTDDLEPYLERALAQAPTFYQPPFLLAAFYANRLERPATIERSFEAAVARFPSNGRLHLTYAEWLLTPRSTAPYRSYRADSGPSAGDARARAMHHVEIAAALEPELVRTSLDLLVRFRVPMETWTDLLPDDAGTRQSILNAADRASVDEHARRRLLASYLASADGAALVRAIAIYAGKWGESELALESAERWHRLALEAGTGRELHQATVSVAREYLDAGEIDRAYGVVRETLAAMEERGLTEDSAGLLVGTGELYLARGRVAMAQSLFTEAATRFPSHAAAYLGLAMTHRRSGDSAGAMRELNRVLELDPGNQQARSLLDALAETR